MRRSLAFTASLAAACVASGLVCAQSTGAYLPWRQPGGAPLAGVVLNCDTGQSREAMPCGGPAAPLRALLMPFVRMAVDPNVFAVTTTASTYAIVKPAAATSYRFVNPCDVDVRIRKVASLDEKVTATTGTLYLARTSEVVGTSNPEFVSLIAMSEPSKPCRPELQYGDGS